MGRDEPGSFLLSEMLVYVRARMFSTEDLMMVETQSVWVGVHMRID